MGLGRLWNGKVVLHSGNNRKRRGTGTRHTSARGQQQLLEGLQTWELQQQAETCLLLQLLALSNEHNLH